VRQHDRCSVSYVMKLRPLPVRPSAKQVAEADAATAVAVKPGVGMQLGTHTVSEAKLEGDDHIILGED
jgi:hypothetical protein